MKKIIVCLVWVLPLFIPYRHKPLKNGRSKRKRRSTIYFSRIAANKVYIDYIEKGYKIAHSGLQTIHDIKRGDFNLHFSFLDSLKKSKPCH